MAALLLRLLVARLPPLAPLPLRLPLRVRLRLRVVVVVLAARREGKGEEQAKRIGVRRYNMHELLRQQHLAELLACRAQFPEPVRAPFPRQASPAAFSPLPISRRLCSG